MADFLVLPRPAESLQNGADFTKNLNILRLLKKRWPQCHKVSSWQVRKTRLCQKKTEQSHLTRSPNCEVGESQSDQEPHLGERGEIRQGAWEEKSGLHYEGMQVPWRRRRASKENLPSGSRRKHKRVSEGISSPGRSAKYWFHSKFGQI